VYILYTTYTTVQRDVGNKLLKVEDKLTWYKQSLRTEFFILWI